MAKGKTLTALISLLKGVSDEDIAKTIADADALEKAQHAQTGDGGEVKDQWQEGQKHSVPSREEIKTGPGQAASGGGAERMTGQYSNPAPQHGVQLDAEKLGKILEDFAAKSHATLKNELARFAALLIKAKDEDEEDEEESETVEINEKAKKLFDKAKKLLADARKAKEDAEDEDGEARKALRQKARQLRKAAAKTLAKAGLYARAGRSKSADLRASIKSLLEGDASLKADVEVEQEEEEDEEEESEKSRSAAPAADNAAAKGSEAGKDAKGNQADKANADGNQDDASKKAIADVTALKGQVEQALAGLTTLQGSVHSVLDAIGKAPKATGGAPDTGALIKGAETTDLDAISAAIEEAQDGGRLDSGAAMRARNIVMQLDALAKGQIARSVVEASINVAPSAVKSLFDGFFKKAA